MGIIKLFVLQGKINAIDALTYLIKNFKNLKILALPNRKDQEKMVGKNLLKNLR